MGGLATGRASGRLPCSGRGAPRRTASTPDSKSHSSGISHGARNVHRPVTTAIDGVLAGIRRSEPAARVRGGTMGGRSILWLNCRSSLPGCAARLRVAAALPAGGFELGSDDREKLSFSERDRLRREREAGHDRPRGPGGRKREAEAREAALRMAESIFSDEGAGSRGDELAKAVRAAHGSAELPAACHAFVAEVGMPRSVDLLQIFLDTSDPSLIVPALEELLARRQSGELELSAGLKSQLRTLSSDPDDDVAGLAEDILA